MVAIGHVGPPGEITSRVIETSIPKIREHADFIFIRFSIISASCFKIRFMTQTKREQSAYSKLLPFLSS